MPKKSLSAIAMQNEQPAGIPDEAISITETEDGLDLVTVGVTRKEAEKAFEESEIDLTIWRCVERTVKRGNVAGKLKQGQNAAGRWLPERLWRQDLWWVTAKYKRRAPRFVQDGVRALMKELRDNPIQWPEPSRNRTSDGHLAEISLYDAHFGKRCWAAETGTDYDLEIASTDYDQAVDDLLDKSASFTISKFVYPVGNDFFQVDSWVSDTTTKGTEVDAVDTRRQLVFRSGVQAIKRAILRCREIAPVEVIWIPGNHDRQTSWHLSETLLHIFYDDAHVTVDNSELERKYRTWGSVLLGFTHGEDMPLDRYPLVMAQEAGQLKLWDDAVWKHWRIGHFHKRKQVKYVAGDTFNGIHVDVLPSLSGTDKWHYRKGYTGNHRTAEISLWSKQNGPAGFFPTVARSAV
jgi:hypothetical protein